MRISFRLALTFFTLFAITCEAVRRSPLGAEIKYRVTGSLSRRGTLQLEYVPESLEGYPPVRLLALQCKMESAEFLRGCETLEGLFIVGDLPDDFEEVRKPCQISSLLSFGRGKVNRLPFSTVSSRSP